MRDGGRGQRVNPTLVADVLAQVREQVLAVDVLLRSSQDGLDLEQRTTLSLGDDEEAEKGEVREGVSS